MNRKMVKKAPFIFNKKLMKTFIYRVFLFSIIAEIFLLCKNRIMNY